MTYEGGLPVLFSVRWGRQNSFAEVFFLCACSLFLLCLDNVYFLLPAFFVQPFKVNTPPRDPRPSCGPPLVPGWPTFTFRDHVGALLALSSCLNNPFGLTPPSYITSPRVYAARVSSETVDALAG